ncbi:MAG TPA: alpha/beta hydrolase [Aliidongia sp.]|nr:alpha/beta hydrolase [Aliidongia sp.]
MPNFPFRRRSFLAAASLLALVGAARADTVKDKDAPVAHRTASGLLGHVTLGSGPEPVLVLHEWLGDHSNYSLALPYLDTHRYRYVFADLRGYGLSRSMTGKYTVDEAASDALKLMDHYGYKRFTAVGHSMSGMIVQYLMLHAADRLDRVVAISPVAASGFHTDEAGLAKLRAVVTDDDAARAATDGRTNHRYGREWLDRKLAITRGAAPEAMLGYLAMFTTTDFSAEVAGLKTPLAIITGDQDIPNYRRESIEKTFGAWYPNMSVTALHDSGHYSMLEEPGLFAAALTSALSGDPAR